MLPASIAKFGIAVAALLVSSSSVFAEKCHKCDFSDEPIIVVGKPAKKPAVIPALPAGKLGAAPCLPGNPACHPVPPAGISVPLPPPSHPIGGAPLLTAKPGTGVKPAQLHCSTGATCNELIAHCAEHGGTWIPSGHGGKGEPTSGDCYID